MAVGRLVTPQGDPDHCVSERWWSGLRLRMGYVPAIRWFIFSFPQLYRWISRHLSISISLSLVSDCYVSLLWDCPGFRHNHTGQGGTVLYNIYRIFAGTVRRD